MGLAEEIRPGMQLPPLVVKPTPRQLVMWAGAIGDFFEAHYDLEYARGHGLPGVIVHGTLKLAWLGRAVSEWAGPNCFVRRVTAEYRGMDQVNHTFTVQGEITETSVEGDLLVATAKMTGVSEDGKPSTLGTVIFDLPLPRSKSS